MWEQLHTTVCRSKYTVWCYSAMHLTAPARSVENVSSLSVTKMHPRPLDKPGIIHRPGSFHDRLLKVS